MGKKTKNKKRITASDYLVANRRASRAEEIAAHGRQIVCRAVHRSKKTYDRNREKAGMRRLPFLLADGGIGFMPGDAGTAKTAALIHWPLLETANYFVYSDNCYLCRVLSDRRCAFSMVSRL